MKTLRYVVVPVVLATIVISLSEFVRNELLLKSTWTSHYRSLGLEFPSQPINNAVWGAWSLLFAIVVFVISRRFPLVQTTLLSWFVAFVLMWVVIGNLGVLPPGLLWFAVPLSLLEAFLASAVIVATSRSRDDSG